MAILAALRKDGFGKWVNLEGYLEDLRLRETGAIAALGAALSAEPADQKELGTGPGAVYLVELASDLRVPKGARLAAARCAMEAGLKEELLAELFLGAGDLVTDPRLGSAAKKLAEQGIPAAAARSEAARKVSETAGAFARAAHAAASVLGMARVRELLLVAPPSHAGVSAALFALGTELPPADRESWQKLLIEQCSKHRRAPAAAKRMGLVPQWPPFLPEAFAPLVRAAEEASAAVLSQDALVSRAPGMVMAATSPQPGAPGQGVTAPAPLAASAGPDRALIPGARKLEAPIRSRRSLNATILEGPVQRPARDMPAVAARQTATPANIPREDAQKSLSIAPLAKAVASAAQAPAPSLPVSPGQPGLAPGAVYDGDEPLRFDPNGRRLSRNDRFRDDEFTWQDPILPPSTLRPPMRATLVEGPFAQRLRSLFEDRPEAVDRLCAAAEARTAVVGAGAVHDELARELRLARWVKKRTPQAQAARLVAIAQDASVPAPWRALAQAFLARPGQEG